MFVSGSKLKAFAHQTLTPTKQNAGNAAKLDQHVVANEN